MTFSNGERVEAKMREERIQRYRHHLSILLVMASILVIGKYILCCVSCSVMSDSVHVILQSRILQWVGSIPSPGDLPNSGIEPGSPGLQTDSIPSEPPGKPNIYYTFPLTSSSPGFKDSVLGF